MSRPSASVERERRESARHYFRKLPGTPGFKSYDFKAYRDHEVSAALAEIFEDKCAYCETSLAGTGTARIEHYRPKGGVEEDPTHPGYWWLAHSWDNLLPSCSSCNEGRRFAVLDDMVSLAEFKRLLRIRAARSVGKMNAFPVAGDRAMTRKANLGLEDPLLLDPTACDPADHLAWRLDGEQSLVTARETAGVPSPRGRESIKTFALNRVLLVKERTMLLNELRYQKGQILDDLAVARADPLRVATALDQAKRRAGEMRRYASIDREYSALALSFVENFEELLAAMR